MQVTECVGFHCRDTTSRARKGAVLRVEGRSLRGVARCARGFTHGRGGFTLTESLIASVVLAMSVIGVAGALSVSYQNSAALDNTAVATTLARQLLEEIAAKPYTDDDDSNAYRSIADYHERPYVDATSGLTSRSGVDLEVGGGQVYTRQVTVKYRLTPDGADVPWSELALVTVTVTPPSPASPVSLSKLISVSRTHK